MAVATWWRKSSWAAGSEPGSAASRRPEGVRLDPVRFRRDPFLRGSAYHLATWSLLALVLELRSSAASSGPGSVLVLVGATFLVSRTHERRVAKMTGASGLPGEAVWGGAGRMWAALIALLAAGSLALVSASASGRLFELWTIGIGAGFVVWGRRAGFGWYAGLGVAMLAAGAADAAWAMMFGEFPRPLRIVVTGLLLPLAALATNRRFLWFRPGR